MLACDGIHSKARRLLLGEDNPASRPSFTHKVAYRAIIPIDAAVGALGEDKANNQCAHLGPDAHSLSFPVSLTTTLSGLSMGLKNSMININSGRSMDPIKCLHLPP